MYVCPSAISGGYFWGLWYHLWRQMSSQWRSQKVTSRIGVSWTHSLPLCFYLFLTQWIMAILSKRCKPDTLESLLSNIQRLRSIFVECESVFESSSFNILALSETNLDNSIDSENVFCEGLFFYSPEVFCYSFAWSYSLCEGTSSFCTWIISRKLWGFSLMFSNGLTALSFLLLLPLLITFVFMHGFWYCFI